MTALKKTYPISSEIRRENARSLVDKHGGMKAFSELIGANYLHITRVVGSKWNKTIGDDLARKIEETLTLPKGWMDNDHSKEDKQVCKIPIFDIGSSKIRDYPLTSIYISAQRDKCDFGIKLTNDKYSPILPNGTIIAFSSDYEKIKDGDLVLVTYEVINQSWTTPLLRYSYEDNGSVTFQPLTLTEDMEKPQNYEVLGISRLIIRETS